VYHSALRGTLRDPSCGATGAACASGGLVAIAVVCLFGLRSSAATGRGDTGAAGGLVPSEFQYVSEPHTQQDWGVSVDDQAAFSSEIFTNNIQLAIVAPGAGSCSVSARSTC
jgi:hypothetical protein